MCISKFKAALFVTILSMVTFLASAIAPLSSYYTIPSSGLIGLPVTPQGVSYGESEIRGVFVHGANLNGAENWETIAETLHSYSVNMLAVETTYVHGTRYPSAYVSQYYQDILTPAINAAHARGMEFHASFNVLLGALDNSYRVTNAAGGLYDWTCPTKSASRTLILNLAKELVTYQATSGPHQGEMIDGFMFDYIRYGEAQLDSCYCSDCKAALEAHLSESIPTFPGPFAPGGARYSEFMEWRVLPINDLVRDVYNAIRSVRPDISISAAVWASYSTSDIPSHRYDLGQDWHYWVKEGWLDWVVPMIYVPAGDTATLAACMDIEQQYGTGGPQGKIPFAAFLTQTFIGKDPATFQTEINTVRTHGGDGWVIWRYGGPGDGTGTAPDIRNYLNVLNLNPTFKLKNITASPSTTSCSISWTTDLPATSKVEFSTSPLFTASYELNPPTGLHPFQFHYWDVDYVPGTVVEDATAKTNHGITLPGLSPGTKYYYRVQSQDASGVATSLVGAFTTS